MANSRSGMSRHSPPIPSGACSSGTTGWPVRVKPGGPRAYIVQYRTREGRSRRVALGQHGLLTIDEARQRGGRRMFVPARHGDDPARDNGTVTWAEVAESCLREHAEPEQQPSSVKEDKCLLAKKLVSALGRRDVRAISRQDVARLHHSLRATPGAANRSLALLSKVCSLCEQWGLRDQGTNPCRSVQRYRENKQGRYLTEDELARSGEALNAAERDGTQLPGVFTAIRLPATSSSLAPGSARSLASAGAMSTWTGGSCACRTPRRERR